MENTLSLCAAESLAAIRARVGRQLGAVESRIRRAPPIDIAARMNAIRLKVAV